MVGDTGLVRWEREGTCVFVVAAVCVSTPSRKLRRKERLLVQEAGYRLLRWVEGESESLAWFILQLNSAVLQLAVRGTSWKMVIERRSRFNSIEMVIDLKSWGTQSDYASAG